MNKGYVSESRGIARYLFLILFCSLAVILFNSCSSSSSQPTTTVLIYIEGTNLESEYSQATNNIKEMLASASSPHLNIVLTTGAADKAVATDPVKSWRTVKRHIIRDGAIHEIQDLGALNMGDKTVLTDFIRWGQITFPAEKYILVFWDHGGGPVWGFGGDLATDTSTLQITQLSEAIRDAVAATGKRLELIGFDACLMATAEIALNIAPYGNYLIASEELEPGPGWDYKPFLSFLAANPHADGLATGIAIADGYAAKTVKETDTYTMSVLDLSQMDNMSAAIEEFSAFAAKELIAGGHTAWNQLAAIRNLADEFGADYVSRRFTNLTDLGHFADLMGEIDGQYRQYALRLQTAVALAVRYSVKDDGHKPASGISFYFPFHDFASEQNWFSRYEAVYFPKAYRDFLKPFMALPLVNPPGNLFYINDPVANAGTIRANIDSPYWISNQFVSIAQAGPSTNIYSLLGTDLASIEPLGDSRFVVSYRLNNKWFALDGTHLITVFFEAKEKGDNYALSVPVLYRPKGAPADKNRPVNLAVRYDYASNLGIIRAAWEGIQPSGMSSRLNVNLDTGDIITPVFLNVDFSTNPEKVSYSYGTPFALTDENIRFSRSPIKEGTYYFFFRVEDLAGNMDISNPLSVSISSSEGKAVMSVLKQKAAMPRFTANTLMQGFWSHWRQ